MSDLYDRYYDAAGCLVTPERPGIDPVPAVTERRVVIGWNAGANSMTELDGDLHTVFTLPAGTAGVVLGLRSERQRQTVPELVEHGLYFQSAGINDMVQVIEQGVVKTDPVSRGLADTFEIRRVLGRVTYWQNDRLLHESSARSTGAKVVNACLYASGDSVGGRR
jgi:hypothetical protein